ncbi:uncharacterized protein LOC117419480 isoform X1 [Acipenser ruthenus]|uniref:uncharacterized protein LOC117419480 isoform X1 n=1 Tax=Acipenser ruthenus TaxID=7906 RepID=UPI0027414D35|nr:uncharacterized protein LOC117419480 isoform X1 [Acipenser ruthenus]
MTPIKISQVLKIQEKAQCFLHQAIANERSRRWKKVVDNYSDLFRLLDRRSLPVTFKPGPHYAQLLYECYFHSGMAFQSLNQHKEAVHQYTKAIQSVSVPKNGCLSGCHSSSCLHTPLFTRRAYAYAKCGELKNALKDAEKAVVLDSFNPAVYCVRALVFSTMGEMKRAVLDLNCALKLNPSLACALILRGTLTGLLAEGSWNAFDMKNKDHKKALEMHQDANVFQDLADFKSPQIGEFYNRFLWCLNVPHTVIEVDFLSGSSFNASLPGRPNGTPSASVLNNTPKNSYIQSQQRDPFRCGTPACYRDDSRLERRSAYGSALRKYSADMKDTGISARILQLTKSAVAWSERRAASASAHMEFQSNTKPKSVASLRRRTGSSVLQLRKQEVQSKILSEVGITVFQAINLCDAPRMYYKPWKGDKLPVTELPIKPPLKVFKV